MRAFPTRCFIRYAVSVTCSALRTNNVPRRHSLSLGTRLTLLYTAVVLIAIALFATLAYWQISERFEQNHLHFLRAKIAEQQTDLREAGGNPQILAKEIFEETAESKPRQYLARLYDANGRLLAETPDMKRKLASALFPPPVSDPLAQNDVRRQIVFDPDDNDRDVFALATARLQSSTYPQPLYVQLALGITGDDKLLSHFRQSLWFSFLLLAFLLVIAGRWIATLGLRPLRQIARTAQTITPERLSERIPSATPWPAELREVVVVFNAMLTRLEEAFNRLSRFSSDLAHELRTPINNMSGELEVCLMRERSDDEYRAALLSNLDECRRLNVLVENLLFVARAESVELALRREMFDGAELCGWVIAQMEPACLERNLRITQQGDTQVYADPSMFRQAITNVLTNAIRHSKAGSMISIFLSPLPDGATSIRVEDQGEGIDAEHIPYIFDRFYQSDASRSRRTGQGTGLGLSIVKTVMTLHGGTVDIASVRQKGTTVTLTFPGMTIHHH
jgi:two-component system, OmpR family, heavy metal sensor histidine kinase CusS